MRSETERHCAELDRCNQRGGRMLSIFDLLEAKTLDLELAAFLMARMTRGASLMVGARPGGAGKTTVMCALLNLAPAHIHLLAATPAAVEHASPEPRCYICHEIGAGHYFAYLWGRDLRAYCALAERGHILATNLHADTIEEARDQVCAENGVPMAHFNAFHLMVFLRVAGGSWRARRHIEAVHESDGVLPHRRVFDASAGLVDFGAPDPWREACRQFLEAHREVSDRTIADVRGRLLTFLAGH